MSRDSDRMDDMIMGTGEVHCLVLVAPRECTKSDRAVYGRETTPGVYLKQEGKGASPIAKPSNEMLLLSRSDALDIARAIDKVAKPCAHGRGSFNRGASRDEHFPLTYAELIERWYAVLAKRLVLAIDAAEHRRDELRVLRAALTGETR